MKLGTLTIHNIASIEDATIEFGKAPLADADVFLISGKTGAGKTTILDAICLALFNDTPRMNGTQMQGNDEDLSGIKVKDARQMLRRGAVEGSVSLTFTGNDGRLYEATWAVQRAHKKPNTKLQNTSRTLKCGEEVFCLKTEVEEKIEEAIGLNFEQFCRTTMLAQGEFTRFLNSNDNDKSEILAKIADATIYEKIGAKVFERTKEKTQEWEAAQTKADAISILSKEEEAALNAEAKQKKADIATQQKAEADASDKAKWVETDDENRQKEVLAEKALALAEEKVKSEEYANNERTTRQWSATTEARQQLSEKTKAEKDLEALKKRRATLSKAYVDVRSGLAHSAAKQEKMKADVAKLNEYFAAEEGRKTVYAKAQTITTLLRSITDNAEKITEENKRLAQMSAETSTIQKLLDEAKKKEATAKELFTSREAELQEKDTKLKAVELQQIYDERNALVERKNDVKSAQTAYANKKKADDAFAATAADLQQRLHALNESRATLAANQDLLKKAAEAKEAAENALAKVRLSVDNAVKALRHALHDGDHCPVCNKLISGDLPKDADFELMVKPSQERFDDAKKEYDRLNQACSALDAKITAESKTYERDAKHHDDDHTVADAMRELSAVCERLGIDANNASLPTLLNEAEVQTAKDLDALEKKIADGEKLQREVEECRRQTDQARTDASLQGEEVQKQRDAQVDNKQKMLEAETQVRTLQTTSDEAKKQIDAIVAGVDLWGACWHANTSAFSSRLKKETTRFEANTKKFADLTQALADEERTAKEVGGVMADIVGNVPEWEALPAAAPRQVEGMVKKANDLKTNVVSVRQDEARCQSLLEEAQRFLAAFYAANPDIDEARLQELDHRTNTEIEALRTKLSELQTAAATKKQQLAAAKEATEKHKKHRPAFAPDESRDLDVLRDRVSSISKTINQLHQEMGTIVQKIDANEQNKARRANMQADADRCKTEADRWNRLNSLIGDQTGKRFRNIAMSYVLGDLIRSANYYMATLSPGRYRLAVSSGTFTIMAEDGYDGFRARPANGLSGGESFLVSLALALALCDVGEGIAVDTLFIDEGFGTLSGDPLQNAIQTLRNLHKLNGRHVGIISHVEDLKQSVGVQIHVEPQGNSSCSTVTVG